MPAFNVQPLASTNLTGIGEYTRQIVRRLLPMTTEAELHVFDFLGRSDAAGLVRTHLGASATELAQMSLKVFRGFPLSVYIRSPKMQRILPYAKALSTQASPTVFFNYLYPAQSVSRGIITIYDMVCYRYPETMEHRNRCLLESRLPDCAAAAEKIITISEFSRYEIMKFLHIPKEKIIVAPCGVEAEFIHDEDLLAQRRELARQIIRQKYKLDDPFFLFLGTLEPRKNLSVLLDAFIKVREKHPAVKLVLCGGDGWGSESLRERLSDPKIASEVIRIGYVSPEDKQHFYYAAQALVFPSLYEGFGLPPLEAMACGTPVVVSDVSSLPEVVGEAGFLCEAQNPESFSETMCTILEKAYDADSLRRAGLLQAASFSWDKSTERIASFL